MGIVIKILLISYIYIVSNGLVNRQIADYSLNSSKWPLLLHALILCRRNPIAWVFSVFIFFSFGHVYLVNKKPYQDRYKLAIILSTYVYIRTMASKIGRVQQTLCLFGWTLWNAFMVLFLHWNLNWNNCSYMKTILFNLLSNKIIQYYRRLDKHFVGIICYWTIHI